MHQVAKAPTTLFSVEGENVGKGVVNIEKTIITTDTPSGVSANKATVTGTSIDISAETEYAKSPMLCDYSHKQDLVIPSATMVSFGAEIPGHVVKICKKPAQFQIPDDWDDPEVRE